MPKPANDTWSELNTRLKVIETVKCSCSTLENSLKHLHKRNISAANLQLFKLTRRIYFGNKLMKYLKAQYFILKSLYFNRPHLQTIVL